MGVRVMAVTLALGLALPLPELHAQQAGPRTVSATATLSILTGDVKRAPSGSSQPQPAADGMNLGVGDRVLTGPKATALVTFLDGSTLTVQPDSDVTVKKADVSGKHSTIGIKVNLGTVWARVVRLADPQSSFSLESNTATATVHDGLIGARQNPDDSFACWTRAGELTVTSKDGRKITTLAPGEMIVVKAEGLPHAFATNQSTLKISASAGVLPLVLMADNARVAGFIAPGVEVNQVFGSMTGVAADGARVVEVPAGAPGPFTLVLEGQQDGPFKVNLVGSFKGAPVYQQELSGAIKKGERLTAEITQQLAPDTAADPKTAKVQGGSAAPLKLLQGPLPGKILLAPAESPTN